MKTYILFLTIMAPMSLTGQGFVQNAPKSQPVRITPAANAPKPQAKDTDLETLCSEAEVQAVKRNAYKENPKEGGFPDFDDLTLFSKCTVKMDIALAKEVTKDRPDPQKIFQLHLTHAEVDGATANLYRRAAFVIGDEGANIETQFNALVDQYNAMLRDYNRLLAYKPRTIYVPVYSPALQLHCTTISLGSGMIQTDCH